MLNRQTLTLIFLVASSGMGGLIIGQSMIIYGQNTTSTTAPVVESFGSLLTSVTGIVIAIGSIIAMLSRTGLLDKRIGSAAVMASDAAVAIRDNRQIFKDFAQNTVDTIKISNPEIVKTADEKLAPILAQASVRIDEYTDKVDKFGQLGNVLSNGGKKTTSEIKDNSQLKDNIPDSIVPS